MKYVTILLSVLLLGACTQTAKDNPPQVIEKRTQSSAAAPKPPTEKEKAMEIALGFDSSISISSLSAIQAAPYRPMGSPNYSSTQWTVTLKTKSGATLELFVDTRAGQAYKTDAIPDELQPD